MAKLSFTDLHGFKDYVMYVQNYLPDRFPHRDWVGPDEQLTFDRAFAGLREGLVLSAREKGDLPVFRECGQLIDEAYEAYRAGNLRDGFGKLESVNGLLRTVPSQPTDWIGQLVQDTSDKFHKR